MAANRRDAGKSPDLPRKGRQVDRRGKTKITSITVTPTTLEQLPDVCAFHNVTRAPDALGEGASELFRKLVDADWKMIQDLKRQASEARKKRAPRNWRGVEE